MSNLSFYRWIFYICALIVFFLVGLFADDIRVQRWAFATLLVFLVAPLVYAMLGRPTKAAVSGIRYAADTPREAVKKLLSFLGKVVIWTLVSLLVVFASVVFVLFVMGNG